MSSIFKYDSSLDYLRDEYELRLRKNRSYSMRSFARDIGTSVSTISEFFSGKHKISLKNSEKIAQNIFKRNEEKEYFLHLCRLSQVTSENSLNHIRLRLKDLQKNKNKKIKNKDFGLIKDWFSLPFFELVKIKKDLSIPLAAKLLGVLPSSLKRFIANAKKLNILKESKGEWELEAENLYVGDNSTSQDIKYFHHQILDKAKCALDHDPITKIEFSNNIMTINKRDLPEMKKYIIQMRRDFQKKFEASKDQDEVYTLSIQFFSLLKEEL